MLGVPTAHAELLAPGQLTHGVPYPVVVKISSRDIPHKTDAGGVRVGITDDAGLARAAGEIIASASVHAPNARIDGLLVQSMAPRLLELMLGYRDDPLVGPTVILGAGGITAEISPDFAIRLAPVGIDDARAMILEVRATRLVRGFRGLPQGDCEALARAIVAFSQLAAIRGAHVAEAEINPLFVQTDGVIAVDGLVRLD